jgi:hypothetical protein
VIPTRAKLRTSLHSRHCLQCAGLSQAEVQEIAEVLSRQSGTSIIEVWNEALCLHRVRYEAEVLASDEERDVCNGNS